MNFSRRAYDLLVIGGGINGAAIAHLAARSGLKVALVEKNDFASGTSSKSTKLIHGGLRYLEHLEFGLVRESLRERFIQLKSSPHLVKPLEFVIPVYASDQRPLWLIKLGVFLYDILSGRYLIRRHRSLSADEIFSLIPGIKKDGLLGGVTYSDAQMDDARLCLENVLSAQSKGADVANYVEACSFLKENGKVVGIKARDVLGEKESKIFEIRAKRTVCATGPWTNRLLLMNNPHAKKRIRTTKGVHVVYKKQISDKALLVQTRKGQRVFFIIPWMGHSLIGTTDTDYAQDPDKVEVEEEDIVYLLKEADRFFPDITFCRDDIITTFAGLRPLVRAPLVHAAGHPSRISRKHIIEETYSGVVFVMGGKYTTYRKIAEECVRKIASNLAPRFKSSVRPEELKEQHGFSLYGSGEISESSLDMARQYGLDQEIIEYLKSKYGIRCHEVLQLTQSNPRLKEKICSCSLVIAAQIVYSIKTEMACTLEDIVWRRLGLGYGGCETKQCQDAIRKYMKG